MTEAEMARRIQSRLKVEDDIKIERETIKKILRIEEDEVYTAIASNDGYRYVWGTVYGISKPPEKVRGNFSEIKSVVDNHGYSPWKDGYPKIKWARCAKVYEIKPPEDYFALEENRYTTAARRFRKDAGLPEIPEYENLPEEKIQEFCEKADKMSLDRLPYQIRRNKTRSKESNKIKTLAVQEYWRKTNYIPYGATDENWDGEQVDGVEIYLANTMVDANSPVDKLDIILTAREIAEYKGKLDKHPELDELEARYRKQIEEAGLQPKEHVPIKIKPTKFTLTYKGNSNPWGIENISVGEELHKKRMERDKQEFLEDIETEKNKNQLEAEQAIAEENILRTLEALEEAAEAKKEANKLSYKPKKGKETKQKRAKK